MADRAFDVTMPEFADVLSQYGVNVARPSAQDAIAPMPRNPARMPQGVEDAASQKEQAQ